MTRHAEPSLSIAPPWIAPRRTAEKPRPAAPAPTQPPTSTPVGGPRTLAEFEQRAAQVLEAERSTPSAQSKPTPVTTTQASSQPVQIACRGLFKSYRKGEIGIPELQGIDLEIRQGEFVAIIGPSGCGKSTLLHVLGTLDQPDAGEVHFEGHRIDNLPRAARDLIRNRHVGMIFQFYHLLPELTALENVLAPALIAEGVMSYWLRRGKHRRRAFELMELLGIAHRAKHRPRELSGGEMQRAAIGRALLARPKVLLADEPTGNLDRTTGEQIMQTLGELKRRENLTIVMVTHDPWIAEQADRTVRLVEGRIQQG
jgi:lipoprotein-releasing system ATP-binding protein